MEMDYEAIENDAVLQPLFVREVRPNPLFDGMQFDHAYDDSTSRLSIHSSGFGTT